jgi:ATP-dependent RNA helicase DOB1
MKRVLRRLGFSTKNNVMGLKGRVACEISTGDELIVTELIFSGAFTDLAVPQAVALLSCFVADGRAAEGEGKKVTNKTEDMLAPSFKALQDIVKRVAKVIAESSLPVGG